jgi:hypothetical protein
VSVAAFQPAAVIYREEQNFAWWVYALLLAVEVVLGLALTKVFGDVGNHPDRTPVGVGIVLALAAASPVLIFIGLLRMTTEVTPSETRVWFGWIPTYRRVLPIGTIQRLEVVRYRPLVDFGGWGIRIGRDGERALNARGDRGVRLHLTDGTRLLIGSQNPEALALAIERAIQPGV